MIQFTVKANTRKIARALRDIHTKDVPKAQFWATRDAIRRSMTASRRALVSDRGVKAMYIPGAKATPGRTRRGSGSRFHGSWGSEKKPHGQIVFLSNHINPTGTKKNPGQYRVNNKLTKTGKKGKNYGKIKAIGGTYDKVFLVKNGHRGMPLMFKRLGKGRGNIKQVTIEMGYHAEGIVRTVATSTYKSVYEKKLTETMKKRIKRRGTR